MSSVRKLHTVLTIAGSDSFGGAGIQADIKTCCAFGVYAMSVITAITAQNSCGVAACMPVGIDMLRAQLDTLLNDIRPDAVKIGMLPSPAHIRVVSETIRSHDLAAVVADPVLISSSGTALTEPLDESIDAYRALLLPLCTMATPNLPEARLLSGEDTHLTEPSAVRLLRHLGCGSLLLKGGHEAGDMSADILATPHGCTVYNAARIDTHNSHGTGCTLSSAIACGLALGKNLKDAVGSAKEFVTAALAGNRDTRLGHGTGPLDFFAVQTRHNP